MSALLPVIIRIKIYNAGYVFLEVAKECKKGVNGRVGAEAKFRRAGNSG